MTPVHFYFVLPTGQPMANQAVKIQLSRSSHSGQITGITMPRPVSVDTDGDGRATLHLWPSAVPYFLEVLDTQSEAAIFYKFLVPEVAEGASVRLQDIVVEGSISDTHYDEAALAVIHAAKVSSRASELAAKASELLALDYKIQAEASIATVLSAADAASLSALNAATSAQEALDRAVAAAASAAQAAAVAAGAVQSFNGRTGAVALAQADVLTALGYTPYNATNPSGFVTALGNIATASKLLNARTINGVAFDGTGNITIPTSDPSYTAADVLAKIKTVDGSASGLDADLLDGLQATAFAQLSGAAFTGAVSAPNFSVGAYAVWHAGSFDPASKLGVGATAAAATKLATARTINGVAFDGTANIVIEAGAGTFLPLSGGIITGDLNVQGTASRMSSHYFHYEYGGGPHVFAHYYAPGSEGIKNTFANLRVAAAGGSYKTLTFGGDGTLDWAGNSVWHAGNFNPASKLDTSSISVMQHTGWIGAPGANADTLHAGGNRTAFTYGNNAPHTGPLVNFHATGYELQLNANYSNGISLSFRTRNGDTNTWNTWRDVWHSGNFNPSSYVPASGATYSGDHLHTGLLAVNRVNPTLQLRDTDGSAAGLTAFVTLQDGGGVERGWMGYGHGNTTMMLHNSIGGVRLSGSWVDIGATSAAYAYAKGIYFEMNAGYDDRVNSAPWYGIGRTATDIYGAGSLQLQVANYYGLRLRASAAILDIRPGQFNVNAPFYSDSNIETTNQLRGTEVFAVGGWLRLTAGQTGLYHTGHNSHIYSAGPTSWSFTAAGAAAGSITLRSAHESAVQGSVYWDSTGFGLLNDQGGWAVRLNHGAGYGGSLFGGWSTSGSFTSAGYMESQGTFHIRGDILSMNAAGSAWDTLLSRNGGDPILRPGKLSVSRDGAGHDPYGPISVTRSAASSWAYYGMTRGGQLGMALGLDTSNRFIVGPATSGGDGTISSQAMSLTMGGFLQLGDSLSAPNYVSGGRITAGYDSGLGGSVNASNWFRSSGDTGWYSATHGVGLWADSASYVRVYGGAALSVPGRLFGNAGTNGGSPSGNGLGKITVSASALSGGAQGDIWCVY